jgi:hypothetical protein
MSFDDSLGTMVLFGGAGDNNAVFNDTLGVLRALGCPDDPPAFLFLDLPDSQSGVR